MTHYELFFFFAAGFKPRDLIRYFDIRSPTAYRAYRNYRKAQKEARDRISSVKHTTFKREKKVNTPDH